MFSLASYKPLLKQVVEEIFNPERPDPVDIEHMSSGLTDLLKTGFSMFMKVSRPHPSDHPLLILFVVGGVTVSEAKMVKDLAASLKPGAQVLIPFLALSLLDPSLTCPCLSHVLPTRSRPSQPSGPWGALAPVGEDWDLWYSP
ncbi:Sec1 family domain-containing protein 2 [Tupaia chinensis]|uniref:Sec1 family domain-containing protein 2 n=1 Tax=Tupaia chinensis TaxID=246437 RepID=L8YC31_TUPCH|nr:Sec1 family domain-containing protein 2 [Tupaia chinensis]